MIWNKACETMDREELQRLQASRLQQTVANVYQRVPFYRELFDRHGVSPADIKSVADVVKLPFTTKTALRDNYPFNMFAVPMKKVVRLHASSGTTGKPTVVGYTRQDIETWSELVARMVTAAGVTDEDVAQVSFGYGLFTGAFGLHYGLEKVGATVVPSSTGNTEKQIMLIQDFGTTALIGTPTYALHMAEVARGMGIDPKSLGVKVGLFGSEAWTESMRDEIEKIWGLFATDNYGLSEIIGPGVAGECRQRQGMHIAEDHFLVEVINPATGEPVPDGEEGELVITSLTKEALPIIRYRTRDITVKTGEPCACGRTHARIRKVSGRTDDMLIVSGVNVFPSQIEDVLLQIDGVAPHYQIIVTKKGYLDAMEIQVEMSDAAFTGNWRDLEALEAKVRSRLLAVLSINPKVKLLEPRSLERSTGKAKRVIDLRQK
ncbi:phenylacetate--CoA ligase family protein [Desulforamulus hydrothermalis]|uniref:Phenylacetate-coenzyme A ligase n=1 Tax=Desulforamulus hydrothermalis Lam5 = DSM 18033 TaxID=1121428 RepID=K8DZB4_9FIRM|nr:phenylacetate--CoA ligase [Desulforamulus hydrothermalis]CCO08392.1 Phenylacetate-coenzyme A ligase [Desulforamulus hydrothermalis Lam5 = DSM 18033]SHH14531.1 phenylacetate-CoA ligase [Desulforamulus hydrothermalis Lam5 = DSM 18033]